MFNLRRVVTAALCLLFVVLNGEAASPADTAAAVEQAKRLQQEQQLRLQQQYEKDLKSSKPPASIDVPDVEVKEASPGGPCRNIKDIQFDGVTKLKPIDLTPLTQPYLNRCLNVGDIERLMSEVTALYIVKGYVTARVYLAQQDLNDGVLHLLVVEGQLEKTSIDDNNSHSISLFNVFPGKVGEPLNLRDVEQALDQINRLQSNNATMQIIPGVKEGGSQVTFKNAPEKTWSLGATYDNHGAETTGKEQAGVNASVDNLFGINDYLSFSHHESLPYDSGWQGSRSDSLTYVVPFGYTTVALNGSMSEYVSPLTVPSGATLNSSGDSENISLRIDRNVFRDRDSRWNLAITLTGKESNNYLEDVLLTVSSRRLTVLDLDSAYAFQLFGGAATFNAGYAVGINQFGALNDADDIPGYAPHAQFKKWKYGGNYQKNFKLLDRYFSYSSQLVGQHSNNVLYGSEMILIGGIYSVRGFSENSLSGDHGYYLRNDIALPIPVSIIKDLPSTLRPYVGLDYGWVNNRNAGMPEGSLTGMAVGVGFSVASFYMEIFNSRALNRPDDMPNEGDTTYFRLSASL